MGATSAPNEHHPSHHDVRASISAALAAAVERVVDATPAVTTATRERRVARANELRQIGEAIEARRYRADGHASPTAWLAASTGESIGHCKGTVTLVARLPQLPLADHAFARGELSESALRVLAEGWSANVDDAYRRDEAMLLGWAQRFPFSDFKDLYDVWRAHADPDDLDRTAADRYDRRALYLSTMLDGVGKLDGILDPEGLSLVREALRALSTPTALDTRTAAQRRADALVDMARLTLEQVQVKADLDRAGEGDTLFGPSLPTRRRKRNRPKVYATIDDDAFANGRGVGTLDTNLDRHVVPATAIRRMACDAGIHRLVTSPLGTVIDHGRERRVVSDTQFDRLHLRDHGCRILGCGVPAAGCDAHHTVNGVGPRTARRATASFERRRRSRRPSSRRSLGAGYLILHSPDGRTLTMRPPAVGAALPAA